MRSDYERQRLVFIKRLLTQAATLLAVLAVLCQPVSLITLLARLSAGKTQII